MDFDVAVIGGGSGGYAAARTSAAAGLRTAVVEGGREVGGLCILRGCMPTKALLYAAEVRHLAQYAALWGIALGSIVRGDIIQKMEEYGESASQLEHLQKLMRDLEQGMKTIQAKIESLKRQPSLTTTTTTRNTLSTPISTPTRTQNFNSKLIELFEKKEKLLENQIDQLIQDMGSTELKPLPVFSNLSTGLESPLDFDRTEIATDSRGFDSIQYSSQYIDMSESAQSIQDRMHQNSSASNASLEGSYVGFSAQASHAWSGAAMNRIGEIKNQGTASKVLFINALVTTRHVRFLKNREYDPHKLGPILNSMRSIKDEKALNNLGIATMHKIKQVYLLTEAVMGGSFSAIVTHLKEDQSSRDTNNQSRHYASQTDMSANLNKGLLSVKGSVGDARQKAHESHRDNLHNRDNTNIAIEFIAQGTIPKFAQEHVIREVLKYQDQNLRKYTSSGSENTSLSSQQRQGELQQAMYTSLNTLQQTTAQQHETAVHSTQSVLKAYDNFCQEIVDDPSCGIPIGFNYTILTQEAIERLLEDKEKISASSTLGTSSIKKEKE